MEYVKVPAPAGLEDVFPDGIEVRKDLYDSGNQEAINQAVIQLGGSVMPMSEWDRRLQFVEGLTSTGRGILEGTGLIEQDTSREMRNRMVRSGDTASELAYYGGAVAEFIPATAIKAITSVYKGVANPILRTALEFGTVGAALGFAQPVYEELGDDRLRNTLTAGGVGAGLGGVVGKFMKMLGAKNEAEFVTKWEEATPEQQLQLEKMADDLAEQELPRLESPDAQYGRKQAEAADAQQTARNQEAELANIRQQGDIAGAQLADEAATAQAKADFETNLSEQRRLTDNMMFRKATEEFNAGKQADYEKTLEDIGRKLREDRLTELKDIMKGTLVPRAAKTYTKELNKANNQLRYWQKQIDDIDNGVKNKGTGGRGPNALRVERDKARADVETVKALMQRADQREAAVKEYVQLVKHNKSDVVDQRIAEATAKIEKPVMQEPAQIAPRQKAVQEPVQVDPATLNAIPPAMRTPDVTPRNAAGSVESLGTASQRAVDRAPYEAQQAANKQAEARYIMNQLGGARRGGTGGVPPTGNATPQGADNAAQAASQKDQSKFGEGMDKFFGSLSTRLGNISQEILGRARLHEFNVSTKNAEHLRRVEPFMRSLMSRIPENMRADIALKLFNGDHAEVMRMLPADMRKEFMEVQKVLKEFKKEFSELGLDFNFIDNYFPRRVKDYDGLLNYLGREKRGIFEYAMNVYAKKNGMKVDDIPAQKKAEIMDQVIRGVFRKGDTAVMPNAKQRKLTRISDPNLLQFYEDPATSLSYYIQNSRETIEAAKFFGRGEVSKTSTGDVDAEKSIGHLVAKIAGEQGLSPQQQRQLESMLRSRFIQGTQAPNKFFATVRDLGYMGTIGNPISALTQLGDIGVSMYKNGIAETIAAMFGKKNYTATEMGIEHTIAHELQNERATSKALNKLFTAVGFRAVDNLGKSTYMTAAIKKNQRLVGTMDKPNAKGEAAFRKKWEGIFGNEIDSVITDLRMGNKTENTKFLAFNELSNVQPISLIEMPQKYLDVPNGRVLYMLKSFTLKQIDLARRDIVQEAAKGNVGEATKNAFLLSSFLAATGTSVGLVKDWLRGRETSLDPDSLSDRAMWSVLGVFGMNQYVTDRYLKSGDILGAMQNTATPAAPIVNAAGQAIKQASKGEDADWMKVLDEVPSIKSTKQIIENFWIGEE